MRQIHERNITDGLSERIAVNLTVEPFQKENGQSHRAKGLSNYMAALAGVVSLAAMGVLTEKASAISHAPPFPAISGTPRPDGDRLVIPSSPATNSTETPKIVPTVPVVTPEPSSPLANTKYTAARGDTLAKIAARYGITTQDLMKANGITNPNLLKTGQRLEIPQKTDKTENKIKPSGTKTSESPQTFPKAETKEKKYFLPKPSEETIKKWDEKPDITIVKEFLGPSTQQKPSYIVLHWTDGPADHNPDITYGILKNRKLSCTFGVGPYILQIQKIMEEAGKVSLNYCQGSKYYNERSISIEISGKNFDSIPPSDQVMQNIYHLVHWLMKTYDIPVESIIGHYQILPKEKQDPGVLFLAEFKKNLVEAMGK